MTEPWRVLVTGSRTWEDAAVIERHLAAEDAAAGWYGRAPLLIHGACPRGADALADGIARRMGWPVEQHPADWSLGRSAGHRRNAEMVALGADAVLAFIRDGSPGASGCARLARVAGLRVVLLEA